MTVKDKLTASGSWLRRRWLVTLVVVAILSGAGWWFFSREGNRQDIPPVKADSRVLAEGIVFPVRYAQMVMPVDGTVGEILTAEGEMVKSGQPLIGWCARTTRPG
jgi:HlyD family secretion protein